MSRNRVALAVLGFAAMLAFGSACGSSSSSNGSPDAGTRDVGPDCFMSPRAHVEIINACTDAQKIDKRPVLPLLKHDGTLPPIP